MNKKPFLLNFKHELTQIDENEVPESAYNEKLQVNVTNDGELLWHVWYTSCHTPSKYIKGHHTPSNKWIPGHTRKSKRDRRQKK